MGHTRYLQLERLVQCHGIYHGIDLFEQQVSLVESLLVLESRISWGLRRLHVGLLCF